jgi:hypothetical protein
LELKVLRRNNLFRGLAYLWQSMEIKFYRWLLTAVFAAIGFVTLAQETEDDYVDDGFMRYEDRVYTPSIRTVLFQINNVNLSLPVIGLNDGQQLNLRFDDLRAEYSDLSYTVIHCDRNWQPTDIPAAEYIGGFLEENISNYKFSVNTTRNYIHYSFSFPNQNFNLKLSGNYLLLVYQDFDRQKPVITRRFRVYEKLVEIEASVRMPVEIEKRRTHHQINMKVLHPKFDIRNPMGDIAVHIQQNYRWDNMKTDSKPIFIRPSELAYDNMGEIVFEGGNEFRWIDIRSLRYQPSNVKSIWRDQDSLLTHIFLTDDVPMRKGNYVSNMDMNGAYAIEFREGNYPDTEADYAMVHFRLLYDEPPMNGGIYIFGGLTDWVINPNFRMEYNYKAKAYEANMLLKQGYYNYQYMFLEDGKTEGSTEMMEASFLAARQIYTFYVYHRQMGTRYDRLIGHDIIGSQN